MATLAVRASSVKNSDDLKKTSEIKYKILDLPSTKVFNDELSDSGTIVFICFFLC